MEKIKKSKIIKTILLLVSTLLLSFPLMLLVIIYVIPPLYIFFIVPLYICFIVPYLIWRIWFSQNKLKIKKTSLLWKIPIIIFLPLSMFYMEILLMVYTFYINSFVWIIIFFMCSLLLLRCMTYSMMIFVLQSNILVSYRKKIYIGIFAYCLSIGYFICSAINTSDIDDYSIASYEYEVSK